jgi:glycerophosphoryl diester phosphodiesterase
MPLKGSAEHAPLFSEFLQTVDGKTPLIIEIKSRHEYTGEYLDALCHATLDGLKGYNGPYCIESFDPRVVKRIRKFAPQVLRGQLVDSYRAYRKEGANPIHAFVISHCFGNFMARPDFIAWCPDKQNWAVRLCARLGAMMVMWTALPEHDQAALEKQYDAVIFQWYHPEVKYK